MQVAGHGDPTVVFEAGGGDDSSVWAKVEPEVRNGDGVRTVVYDRAGLGKSAAAIGPYHIDNEATALKRALDRFGVRGPVILVAHAYGGFIATLVAASDKRIAGVVLVDAHLAGFFDDAQVAQLVARTTPEVDALERTEPARAHVMAQVLRAFPETVRRMRGVALPEALPVIDIVAEHSWAEGNGQRDDRSGDQDGDDSQALRKAHAAFVDASPSRRAVIATGSGSYVMRDQPQLVVDAVSRMVRYVNAPRQP